MKKEVIVHWMDALIDEWHRMRSLRTLSEDCGSEFCSCLNFHTNMEFHLNTSGFDRKRMKELAFAVDTEIEITDFDEDTDEITFWYRGFKFFALDRKE